ncbi:GspE/PulE family protein [Vitreimonas flagellata]|uniref:GspE/PulE family protein n=1 Tax=Vitreimonas flagellata TaxID=2560861 RepID=UPI0010750C0B|nr:GspE/PulE family protein [Vitreimonas flagellata]
MHQLGEILVERGLAPADAVAIAAKQGEPHELFSTLMRIGVISEDALLDFLSDQFRLPVLPLEGGPSLEAVRETLATTDAPIRWFIEHDLVLWRDAEGRMHAAGPRAHEAPIQEALEQWVAGGYTLHLAKAIMVDPILMALRGEHQRSRHLDPRRLAELAEEAPVIDFVNSVLSEALSRSASDIHFEPFEDKLIVRMRVDGVLTQRRVVSIDMFDAVSSRLKLLSGMNIAERRLPQDGRQSINVVGQDVDLRVSSLPTTWGESIVLRLLGATHRIPELSELGLTDDQCSIILEAIHQPHGLVLITGPTGSGKTTTVYRLLSELNDGVRKIVTIEDPVELNLPGVLQMGVRADIELDFAAGLRSILRQDPDIIFVGEIRDAETAQTAVQAALTGHLVISTVHTNSALAAAARLNDLGVEPFLLADVLRMVIGQRLVRCVCTQCGAPEPEADIEQKAERLLPGPLRTGDARWRHGIGCSTCGRSGYQGRIGVFEAARVTPALQHAIRNREPETVLTALAREDGFSSLLENALVTARKGQTTFVEALRVLGGGA